MKCVVIVTGLGGAGATRNPPKHAIKFGRVDLFLCLGYLYNQACYVFCGSA